MKRKPKLIKRSPSDYCFYATLLDCYQNYADAENSWEQYYGGSENIKITEAEWEEKLKQDLLNRINRVSFTSDAAMHGTQFNNAVDLLVQKRMEDKEHKMWIDEDDGTVSVADKVQKYDLDGQPTLIIENYDTFPLASVKEFADYYDGALCQQFCKGTIDTAYGNVELYGYIDYLLPFSVHDLKTTNRYNGMGSFRHHYQHLVYPLCLHQMGADINTFEYNILRWGKDAQTPGDTFTEQYVFDAERDVPVVREACEGLVRFIEANKDQITDIKVFNLKEEK